jgi:hypothetical protein
MAKNRCRPSPDGLFNCDVDWEVEAGPSTCTYFERDALFCSRCEHWAVGHCLSSRATAEAAKRRARDLLRESMDEALAVMNQVVWSMGGESPGKDDDHD